MPIFLDDADFVRFLRILGDVLESSQITCWNYCLMPNHYHATLQPSQANLSQALRRVNSEYALWWNRRQGRVGHVFQGRFKDQVVDQDQYLLALSRYVVMNPVRANLVQKPEDWRWSSYRATVGLSSAPSFLNNSTTLRLFGDGSESELRASFARWVSANVDDWTAVDRIRSNERILGSQDFKGLVSSCS
ncbi:MAG TPA: transposase, partial [Vicinamibacterales bacterium]|nr:transposase [Vicinamibacterales bacterium]